MSDLVFGSNVYIPGKGAQLGRDKKPGVLSCLPGWRTKDVPGSVTLGVPSSKLPNQSPSPAFINKTNQNFGN